MRLLFVHGRAQEGKSSASLEQEWMSPLRRGAAAAGIVPLPWPVDVPFYGDELKALADSYDLPPADNLETRGGIVQDDYQKFLGEVAVEAQERYKVRQTDLEGVGSRGPENWQWVQAVIRAIDRVAPDVASKGIGLLLRDVFLYVNYDYVRRKIDPIITAALTEERTVVIGHSLGSVVTYNVLRLHGGNNVARLITVGSPLGIRAVRDRLTGALAMPAGVADWFNARDTRDVVALYPLDRDNFDITPSIRNDSDIINHTENRHGIDGYLDDARVAKEVYS